MRCAGAIRGAIAVCLALLAGVSSTPAPYLPRARAAAAAASGRVVWVALEDAHQMVKVDLDAREILARRSVPGAPHNLSISPDGRTIATTLWSAGAVVVRHRGEQRTARLGGAPHDAKIGGDRIVVANQTEARLDILGIKGRFLRSIPLKADPHDLALRWGGRQAWVTLEGDDDLAVVRIRTNRVRYVSTGKQPHDLLFAPDGKLWVSDWDGAIHVFSRRGRRLASIPLGVEAHHLDFTPDGRRAWITDHAAHRVYVIGTERYRVRKRFAVAGAPHHIAITSDGRRAVVADHDRGVLIVYNTKRLWRAFTIRVGAGPHGIWAMP
ncbi:MAG: hypothetical protein M3345_03995 [Actinomycetota bacterium]|nr:hypothetical protein [Actinomycetota bacterium]